ncbi:DUF3089 domain-containing protein [Qipengyuania sp.]|uniref:DUF3089 domain-containing protein n=1 Tax=Qipengyuania sp. TaxID=2004515 RepID=UPI003736B210
MARKFLYLVAGIIILVIAGAFALAIWSNEATRIAFVPRGEFVEQAPLADNAYQDPAMWYSRPGIGTADPARYQPPLASPTLASEDALPGQAAQTVGAGQQGRLPVPSFAVFFVPPTSYIRAGGDWNAPLGDAETDQRARLFLRGLATPFNRADEIWAPRYRQAAAGAFLTAQPEAGRAIDAAYADIVQAFEYFLAKVPADKPIVLAGHSQGALHVLQLLQDKVDSSIPASRIAGVYAIGWPISIAHDLPALPLPACATPGQPGCIVSWSSFADDGDPSLILERYRKTPGYDGQPRGDGPILCINPLTGTSGGSAPASANRGTLMPSDDLTSGELVPGLIPARCDPRGLLLIGQPPAFSQGVLPGGNYHVYDIPLFWQNLQDDVAQRVAAWTSRAS